MKLLSYFAAAALFSVAPLTANASYIAQCNALISKWNQCGGDLAACTIVEIEIMQQCKCHQFDEAQNQWELIGIQNAPDGVCGKYEPIDDEPRDNKEPTWTFRPKPGEELKPGIVLPVPKIGVDSASDAAGAGAVGGALVGKGN